MKHAFIDTNVLIDFLADRKPFSIHAAQLFDLAQKDDIRLYISAVSFSTVYYILRQSLSHEQTIQILRDLSIWTETVNVSGGIIEESLHSGFTDFEDAIQYYCAQSVRTIDVIVTRNKKDFKMRGLPIMIPGEAVGFLQSS